MDKQQFQNVMDKLEGESDRAYAILSASLLEELLGRLLRRFVHPDSSDDLFTHRGPLGGFSARIEMAYAVGLLTKQERSDLNLIRKIRNDFAHGIDHTLSFETPAIADRTKALGVLAAWKSHEMLKGDNDTPRWHFGLAVGFLAVMFADVRIPETSHVSSPRVVTFNADKLDD